MLSEAPNRLHWVRLRDALVDVDAWRRVQIVRAEGKSVTVVALDVEPPGSVEPIAPTELTCARLERFPELLDDTLRHEDGGMLAFWNGVRHMIAIPEASSCAVAGTSIAVTASVVIIEDGRNFELVASDSSWRMRLFDARLSETSPKERLVR